MAITISGENNNDKILASDGVIDQISGFSIVGVVTATSFTGDLTGNVTGNLTGNVNSTSPLLLQTGGSERFRITGNNELGIAGANYGSSGQVLTSGGSGSAVSWTTPATQTSIVNYADNKLVTATASGTSLNAEANLTFDGAKLTVTSASKNLLYLNSTHSEGPQISIQTSGTTFSYIGSAASLFSTGSSTDLGFRAESGKHFLFGIGSSEKVRITSTGKVLIGHDTPIEIGVGAGYQMPLQVIGTSYDTSGMVLARYANDGNGPTLAFVKSRNATKGAQTIVQANDTLGMIRFLGSDGTDTQNAAVRIRAFCDGTPASNKIPGRITFETTDTLTYARERMRIDSSGRVVIGGPGSNGGGSNTYIGGGALAVLGTPYTPNTYACFAMGRVGANVTANTTITNIRLNGGTLGTGRGAEINAAADANWSDASSHPTRLTFHTVPSGSTSSQERLRINADGKINIGTLYNASTTHLDIRFDDTTAYSNTSNHVNGLKIFNDCTTDNGFAGIELAATDGDDYYGSTLLKSVADGTNYSNDFVIQTRHSGSYGERLRIQSDGNIGIGEWGTTTIPQGLSLLQKNLYLNQGKYITWNNGDCEIAGISGYHLKFSTYNGSSMTEAMQLKSDSSLYLPKGLTNRYGMYEVATGGTLNPSSATTWTWNFITQSGTGSVFKIEAYFNHWNTNSNYWSYQEHIVMHRDAHTNYAGFDIRRHAGGLGSWATEILTNTGNTYNEKIRVKWNVGSGSAYMGGYFIRISTCNPIDPESLVVA